MISCLVNLFVSLKQFNRLQYPHLRLEKRVGKDALLSRMKENVQNRNLTRKCTPFNTKDELAVHVGCLL